MPEVTLRWTWELRSPLHCGSGLSRAGHADRLVQFDEHGNPIIVGDAVKGALRMAAEQVVAWIDAPQQYRSADAWLAEPRSRPLALVFGGDAMAHFEPARLVGEAEPGVFTSTAIYPRSGTAREKTLRTTEFVPPGARCASSASVAVDDADAEAVTTLLVAALAAVEHVGAKAGIGWGAVQLADLEVRVDGQARHPQSLVNHEHVEALKHAVGQQYTPVSVSVAVPARNLIPQEWYRLDIELREPVTLGSEADISNIVGTERIVRGSTLRGACAQAWRRSGSDETDILRRLGEATRWSPAFPVVDAVVQVPVPASWMCPKEHRGRPLRERSLFDDLTGKDHSPVNGAQVQWVGVGGGCVAWSEGAPNDGGAPVLTRMHVARDYFTGSKVAGALYARQSVGPHNARFVAFARLPSDAWSNASALDLWLGKRKSAGNGLASLTATRIDVPTIDLFGGSRFGGNHKRDADVYIQLLAPALVRDRRTGHPLRTLDIEWWAEEYLKLAAGDLVADSTGSPLRSFSSPRTAFGHRGGWMAPWRHPRAPVTVVEQGSVWRLRCTDPPTAERVRDRFPRGLHQIGERQHEGFGWLAVDPIWLPIERGPDQRDEHKSARRGPQPWPGTGVLKREDVLALLAGLPTARELAGTEERDDRGADRRPVAIAGPLHELARQAREARTEADVATIKSFYEERLDRKRQDAWKLLADTNALPEACWRDPESLRFRIEALLIRAAPFGRD